MRKVLFVIFSVTLVSVAVSFIAYADGGLNLGGLLSGGQEASTSGSISPAAAGSTLTGLFKITKGVCGSGGVTSGSYFRMVASGGNVNSGPFVDNTDSPCGDDSYSPMTPGTDGGLLTTGYQPNPNPAFNSGNGLAKRIAKPVPFFGVDFAVSTNSKDPQTDKSTVVPVIRADGGSLKGDLRAFAAAWSGQHFNQGSPKPDGSKPGNTTAVSGTYNASTGAYELNWASQIVGGAFNNFTGTWHLEGTFVAKSASKSAKTTQVKSGQQSGSTQDTGTVAQTGAETAGLAPGLGLLGAGVALRAFASRRLRRREVRS